MEKLRDLGDFAFCLIIIGIVTFGAVDLYGLIEQQALLVIPSIIPR